MAAFFIAGLLILIWVYRDAEKRGMNGALWLIIVLLANFIGLIMYVVVREPEITNRIEQLYPTAKYCEYCRNTLPSDARFCSKCGKEQT